mgnify:CR=1 FL=1
MAKLSTAAKRLLSGGTIAIFCDQQTANTAAQSTTVSPTAPAALRFNTTLVNTITGCSLASNQITLPAGRYHTDFFVYALNNVKAYAELYNVTDSAVQTSLSGEAIRAMHGGANSTSGTSEIHTESVFEISAQKVFEVRACTNTSSTYGAPMNLDSKAERYQHITFTQVY